MESVQFQLGSDPELMLREIATKRLRSAIPIIEEGKGKGRPLDETGENSVLHDNVLIEFNTKPAADRDEFVQTIGFVLKKADSIVAKSGLELHLLTSADFPESELNCLEAKVFGCDPDYDAYRLVINETPASAAKLPFRSTGGHLHIGKHTDDEELQEVLDDPFGKVRVVKALDVLVGITSVFLDKDPTAPARRRLYGKAGCHRPKDYGVEYRACGPWWLASPQHTELVYRLTAAALSVAVDEDYFDELVEEVGGEDKIQAVVNESQMKEARRIYNESIADILDDETKALVAELDLAGEADIKVGWKL